MPPDTHAGPLPFDSRADAMPARRDRVATPGASLRRGAANGGHDRRMDVLLQLLAASLSVSVITAVVLRKVDRVFGSSAQ